MENQGTTGTMDAEWGVDLSDLSGSAEETVDQPETESQDGDTETSQEDAGTEPAKAEEGAAETETAESGAQQESGKADQPAAETYQLKHLGDVLEVDRTKVTELAQKGLDYDHVKEKLEKYRGQVGELQKFRDENEELASFLEDISRESGMSREQMIDTLRANQYVQKGMNADAARERVAREKAERRLNAAAKQKTEQNKEAEGQKTAQEKRDADIREFLEKFPGVDPSQIPKSVWSDVGTGTPLSAAYQKYQTESVRQENERLKAQLAAREKNEQNRKKSVGSQKTGGAESAKDPFLEALFGKD